MLLRSVTKHVKDQNWFAVLLDFFIVVVGILIAFQITNWNEERTAHARAEAYSEQLLAELRAEFDYATSIIDYYASLRDANDMAFAGLAKKVAINDEVILVNAFRASQYNWYERRRATFDEIVASGSLGLISDTGLREAASGIYNTPIFSIIQSEGVNSRYRELCRMAIQPSLHDDLDRNCGDKEYESSSDAVGLVTLDFDCALDASAGEVTDAVHALRSDPEILRALKLRYPQVTGRAEELELTLRTFGLNTLFADEAAKQ